MGKLFKILFISSRKFRAMVSKTVNIQKGTKIKLINKETEKRSIVTFKLNAKDNIILVEDEDGKEILIDTLLYIIEILPLIERIILWFRRLFRGKRK